MLEIAFPHSKRFSDFLRRNPALPLLKRILQYPVAKLGANSAFKGEFQHVTSHKFGVSSKQRLPTIVWFRRGITSAPQNVRRSRWDS